MNASNEWSYRITFFHAEVLSLDNLVVAWALRGHYMSKFSQYLSFLLKDDYCKALPTSKNIGHHPTTSVRNQILVIIKQKYQRMLLFILDHDQLLCLRLFDCFVHPNFDSQRNFHKLVCITNSHISIVYVCLVSCWLTIKVYSMIFMKRCIPMNKPS